MRPAPQFLLRSFQLWPGIPTAKTFCCYEDKNLAFFLKSNYLGVQTFSLHDIMPEAYSYLRPQATPEYYTGSSVTAGEAS